MSRRWMVIGSPLRIWQGFEPVASQLTRYSHTPKSYSSHFEPTMMSLNYSSGCISIGMYDDPFARLLPIAICAGSANPMASSRSDTYLHTIALARHCGGIIVGVAWLGASSGM